MDALFAALGTFAALASFSLALALHLWRLRRNEIAHIYRHLERVEERLERAEERLEGVEHDLADVRERIARLEERVSD